MNIEDFPHRKQREIKVGHAFIAHYNQRHGTAFTLDEAYWASDSDPSPDIRFVDSKASVFAEVVSFDEGGQEGFVRSAGLGRLLAAIQDALDAQGAKEFSVMLEPVDPLKIPHGAQLRSHAHALVAYIAEKVRLLEDQHYQWHEHYESAYRFATSQIRDLDIALTPIARAYCAVTGGVRVISTVESLREAIHGKTLKRYGPGTHLVIDNQGHLISTQELLALLGGEQFSLDGFDGVWFVSLTEGRVVPLHEPSQHLASLSNTDEDKV